MVEETQRIEKRLGACNNKASGTRETSALASLTRAGVSLAWLLHTMRAALAQIPDDFPLNVQHDCATHRLQNSASHV
jgi:hypothetical protein